ncbi:hypothetical protein [Streptomyces sp. NPDC002855]|uniref:hypothetical protein n=1 Tax=Streptomyces sp. NPDC002855 TaxID=3154437 RepID=UPI00331FF540
MTAIEATGRETLSGLRRMLGALREANRERRNRERRNRGGRRGWRRRGRRCVSVPDPASPPSTASPRRRPPPVSASTCGGSANSGRCQRRSTCPRTASSRRRSPMSYAMRAPHRAASPSTAAPTSWPSR